jgi:hypothetical protein
MKKFPTANKKIEAAMNAQMDADKEYFDKHPNATSYIRKPHPNEIQQGILIHGEEPKNIEVLHVGQGLRFKKFLYL